MIRSILAFALLAAPLAQAAPEARPIRRFALLAGANDGGADRVRLRYAVTDAEAMGEVLGRFGGVAASDQVLVTEPDPAALEAAFAALRGRLERARAAGDRVEVLFYYSGHSDEAGLRLGGAQLGYGDLRRAIDALPADVRIAIVDACASGALTRGKGGTRQPPFLVDAATRVRGYAFLTSASADEAAQESDRVGGSFFTHALLSGLRGAADVSEDGRVTLNEAYQFAYHETLARTEETRLGAQHPNYDLNLSGRGDVVLTDVRSTGAGLVLPEQLHGRLYVRDPAGRLVAELHKPAGRAIELGFAPGDYQVTLDRGGALARAEISLADGVRTPLPGSAFTAFDGVATTARGDATVSQAVGAGERVVPANFGLVPGVSTNEMAGGGRIVNNLSLSMVGDGWGLRGLDVAMVGNIREGYVRGVQAAAVFNMSGGPVEGVQGAPVFNMAGGRVKGVQGAAVFNMAGGPVTGVQGAAVFNMAGGTVHGVQGAAVFNAAAGEVHGVQGAAIFNGASAVRGVQLSAAANVTERLRGLQVGLVNVADEATGMQIGLVNVASKMKGAPVGLINIIGDGVSHVEMWGSDISPLHLGLRLGSQNFYSTFSAAGRFDEEMWLLGFGLGGRLALSPHWNLDVDVVGYQLIEQARGWSTDELDLLNRARLGFGWQFADDIGLIFGPALNVLVSQRRDGDALAFGLGRLDRRDDINIRTWPGAFLGLRLF